MRCHHLPSWGVLSLSKCSDPVAALGSPAALTLPQTVVGDADTRAFTRACLDDRSEEGNLFLQEFKLVKGLHQGLKAWQKKLPSGPWSDCLSSTLLQICLS